MPHELKEHFVEANEVRLRVYEQGEGPVILFVHGFPESGRVWHHQLPVMAAAGFRAIAPDMRGVGASSKPEKLSDYTILHRVGDMVCLLRELGVDQAVIVGHDWGAPVAWNCAALRPDIFRAVVGVSFPHLLRGARPQLTLDSGGYGDGTPYTVYFQTPGVADAELNRDPAETLRRLLHGLSANPIGGKAWYPSVPHGGGFLDTLPPAATPPHWVDPEWFKAYVGDLTQSGFTGGLNYYRNIVRDWEVSAAFGDLPIRVPALFAAGVKDPVLSFPGTDLVLEAMKVAIPTLRGTKLIPNAGHWAEMENPAEFNRIVLEFIRSL